MSGKPHRGRLRIAGTPPHTHVPKNPIKTTPPKGPRREDDVSPVGLGFTLAMLYIALWSLLELFLHLAGR